MALLLRRFAVPAALVTAALAGAAVAVGCSSEETPTADPGDAGSPSDRDGGGTTGPASDAGAGSPDACAAIPPSCTKDEECTCNTVCAGLRCVPRAKCDEALLSWDGPTTRLDGTCVTDVAGYVVQLGRTPGGPYDRVDAGNPCVPGPPVACGDAGTTVPQPKCATRIGPLDGGAWYFVVSAYTANQESPVSGEVTKTIACP